MIFRADYKHKTKAVEGSLQADVYKSCMEQYGANENTDWLMLHNNSHLIGNRISDS